MSYIGEARRPAVEAFGAAALHMATVVGRGVIRFAKAVARRRVIANLGEFDDRMLRDIGLTRADLRDAASGPLWQDPTRILVVRAVEKRAARRIALRHPAAFQPASVQRDPRDEARDDLFIG